MQLLQDGLGFGLLIGAEIKLFGQHLQMLFPARMRLLPFQLNRNKQTTAPPPPDRSERG
jgi:hypothetical protein